MQFIETIDEKDGMVTKELLPPPQPRRWFYWHGVLIGFALFWLLNATA